MSTTVFNREIKKIITSENHPVLNYVNEKFKKSIKHKSYYGFFDDFLFRYGILTLGKSPTMKGNKYISYVNCTRNNIFREEKGTTFLSKNTQSLSESQKTKAHYLIQQLKCLNVQNFEDWNPEFNHGEIVLKKKTKVNNI